MPVKTALVIVMIWASFFVGSTGLADERLWLDAKINGKSARLCFDSGSETMCLFREAAPRFGLKVSEPSTNAVDPGKVAFGTSEECVVNLQGEEPKARFFIVNIPAYLNSDCDGVVGWRNVSGDVLSIDAVAGRVTFLPKLPKRVSTWVQLTIVTNSDSLMFEIPHTSESKGIICVDTGTDMGVMLPPEQWQIWKAGQAHRPVTLKAYFTPADGIVVVKEAWATQFSFGPLTLANVPIAETAPVDVARGSSQYEGTLGLAALKRLEVILDMRHGVAFLHPRKSSPPPYQHNRLGAVFVPNDPQSDELVARVADGSPAEKSGVRTGDVLLKVGKTDVTKEHQGALRRFELPPGTKLDLTLRRDGNIFKTTATLHQFLPSSDSKEGKKNIPQSAEPDAAPNVAPHHR